MIHFAGLKAVGESQNQPLRYYDNNVNGSVVLDDLAAVPLAALAYLSQHQELVTVNLGSGRPYSVLEMIHAFEKASGRAVPYEVVTRRPGDLAEYYAEPSLAESLLGWKAQLSIDRMCEDTWRWQSMNPGGYGG